MEKLLAVVRIRGSVGTKKELKDTMEMLKLTSVNHCTLVPNTPSNRGMLEKVGDYVTWGDINKEVLEELVERRARLPGDERIDKKTAAELVGKILKNMSLKGLGIKGFFRLSPPSKGFRSVKRRFPTGDLGNRGEAINELLRRMV